MGVNDYAKAEHDRANDNARKLLAVAAERDTLARLHEVATERLAAVRIALDRVDARFAARDHGLSIFADFHADVAVALTEDSDD